MTATFRRRRLLVGAAALAATACVPNGLRTPAKTSEPGPASPLAARPPVDYWPASFKQLRPETRDAYRYAAAHEDVLRYIPCYCGCTGQGHRNNYDCYVAEARADGWVVLNDHAFG